MKFIESRLRPVVVSILFLSVGAVVFNSCKERTILPPDLIPPIDNIHTFESDTFGIVTHTVYQDSILTGGSNGFIGVYNNPSFYHALGTIHSNATYGFTRASLHVEVIPPTSNFTHKGYDPVFDSIVLAIPFKGTFGDTLKDEDQSFLVYRSLKSFPKTESQFEFTKDSFNPNQPMASYVMNYASFRKDSNNKFMRIKLASWFADSLKAQMDSLNVGGATSGYDKFLAWWKGFYVTAISAQGSSLGYFNTYGTRMYLYYRYYSDSAKTDLDTTIDVFSFDPNFCNRFNYVERRYPGSLVNSFLNTSSLDGDSICFAQNLPGVATEIRFPHLPQFTRCLVNKAELHLYSDRPISEMADTLQYGLIPKLQVFKTVDSVDRIISEYSSFSPTFVNGKRDTISFNGEKYLHYKVMLTETVQKLIAEKDTSLRIKFMGLTDVYPGAFGMRWKGSGSKVSYLKPRLYMIYTKY